MKKLLPALAAALLAAAPSHAVTGVSTIQITNAFNDYLQVGELLAFQTGTGNNVALASAGAVATGTGGTWDANSTPDRANDGNLNTEFYTAPYIFHPAAQGGTMLSIALSGPMSLQGLTIYGRSDCCSSRDLFTYKLLSATGATLATGELDARGTSHSASVAFGAVPETASWALMLAGFGVVGLGLRGTRRRTALTA
jgi:hypothetical protein